MTLGFNAKLTSLGFITDVECRCFLYLSLSSKSCAASITNRMERCLEGGCDCRYIRYRLSGDPLIVHCCHCRWCQRETGSAFVVNALFASEHVTHVRDQPDIISTPSESGKGQRIARCPKCYVAVWSNYKGAGELVRFVRVGTLDTPNEVAPDVHIYTASKVPWVQTPKDVPAYAEFYDVGKMWAKETDERRHDMMVKLQAPAVKQAPEDQVRQAHSGT